MSIPMSTKSPAMIEQLEKFFPGTKAAISDGKCPLCRKTITSFRDLLSEREYAISGMCQSCQDDIFNENDEC
jgi:hypothetical protein